MGSANNSIHLWLEISILGHWYVFRATKTHQRMEMPTIPTNKTKDQLKASTVTTATGGQKQKMIPTILYARDNMATGTLNIPSRKGPQGIFGTVK